MKHWVFLVGFALACEPLTYSREGALDFARYRSAAVSVNERNVEYTSYLVGELDAVSGFASVAAEPAGADVHLTVSMAIEIDMWLDDEGDAHVDYNGIANYAALDRQGALLIEGEHSDSSFSYDETAEDLLDEVAQAFMRPYRL